jgi:hypothetical protein
MQKKGKIITDISVMIAGMAGHGVLFTGNVLAKILKRQGWEIEQLFSLLRISCSPWPDFACSLWSQTFGKNHGKI